MCGIAGIYALPSLTSEQNMKIDSELLEKMNTAQAHRGPNDQGYHFDHGVGLAHRRLSIIDLAGGHQPIYNEDGQVVVVFNGEIYNYKDIAAELKEKGHIFKTVSDTETIVHAWEEWGINCVDHFRGMFAFAIWDNIKKELFIARDRLGIKPLHYSLLSNGQLIFGSELKVLKQHPKFNENLSLEAIEDYLTLGYVPDPKSIYQGTFKLEAGHYIHLKADSKHIETVQYWDLPWQESIQQLAAAPNHLDYQKTMMDGLTNAVKLRMVSEVPIGSFLSGGVDSSAVVAIMASLQDDPINTCAIGFDVPEYNESDFAQAVADRYKTNHNLEIVNHEDFALIEELTNIYDEPYADSSALPTYRVCEMAKKHVTVCLSGDGGDELFAGYRRYKMHLAEEKLRNKIPAIVRKAIFKPLGKLYPKLDWAPQFLRAKTTFQSLSMSSAEAYLNSMSKLRKDEREKIYSPEFKKQLNGYRSHQMFDKLVENKNFADPLKQIQYLDFKTWMPGDILTKVDRASMQHGLEVRVPILDHKFVEWSFTLPSSENLKKGEGKAGFKQALEPIVPHDNLYRDKMGFSIPLSDWLKGPLKEKLERTLNNDKLKALKLFDHKQINQMINEHCNGKSNHDAGLWTLMMLGQFIEKNG